MVLRVPMMDLIDMFKHQSESKTSNRMCTPLCLLEEEEPCDKDLNV